AAHPQVQDPAAAVVEVEHEILGSAPTADELAPGQRTDEARFERLPQRLAAHVDRRNRAAANQRHEAAENRLYFRKLGHLLGVARTTGTRGAQTSPARRPRAGRWVRSRSR